MALIRPLLVGFAPTLKHLFRTPIERAERIAPFLFEDTDPYAVTDGNRIKWMVNGISTTNRYPYSEIQVDRPLSDEDVDYVIDRVWAAIGGP